MTEFSGTGFSGEGAGRKRPSGFDFAKRTPVVVVAAAASATVAALALARSPDLTGSPIFIFAVVAALSLLVLGAFCLVGLAVSAGPGRLWGMPEIAEDAGAVIALTDQDGGVLRHASGAAPRRLSDALAALGPDALAAGVRIGAEANQNGAGAAQFELNGRVHLLQALRIPGGRLLWTRAPLHAGPARATLDSLIAAAVVDNGGAVLETTPGFDALGAQTRDRVLQAAVATWRDGGNSLRVAASGDADAVVAIRAIPEDRILITMAPTDPASAYSADIFDVMPVAVAVLTLDGKLTRLNAAAKRLLGPDAAQGAALDALAEGLGRPIDARIREAARGDGAGRPELARGRRSERTTRGGPETFLQISLTRIDFADGPGIVAVMSDATELKMLEQKFVQSQKMQAVGQLAGGVAHDFNNLLTAIIGHCDLMSLRLDETSPDYDDLTQIRQNANRAAALVRQLLAFSRRQKLNPTLCSLPNVLDEISNLLNRLIGEKITLEVVADADLWEVYLDAQQFEQVVLNLVVNARDAMPDGGSIRIICGNESLDREIARDRAVVPTGDYVRIDVVDDGHGIAEDVRDKVFEPFFTTKEVGEGTGLGLSTVYGIIKQTGGFIFVDSAEGGGSIFRILLPRPDFAPERNAPETADPEDLSGSGRILLVEDEAPVRTFSRRALEMRGYRVFEADNAEAALKFLDGADGYVDLVISDVVMPGMDGPSWVREARKTRPGLSVIFTSGYSEEVFRKGAADIGNCSFLPKPYSLEDLALAVKRRIAG